MSKLEMLLEVNDRLRARYDHLSRIFSRIDHDCVKVHYLDDGQVYVHNTHSNGAEDFVTGETCTYRIEGGILYDDAGEIVNSPMFGFEICQKCYGEELALDRSPMSQIFGNSLNYQDWVLFHSFEEGLVDTDDLLEGIHSGEDEQRCSMPADLQGRLLHLANHYAAKATREESLMSPSTRWVEFNTSHPSLAGKLARPLTFGQMLTCEDIRDLTAPQLRMGIDYLEGYAA